MQLDTEATQQTPMSVLVVDDEPQVIWMLQFSLQAEGYETYSARDGRSALEEIREHHPTLMLLDIMMPVMDGYQLNERLQKEPRTKEIPILVLTAKGQKMRELFEMAPNVAAYVQKPFDPKMLRELIGGILAAKKR